MPKNLLSSTLPLLISIILFVIVGNFGVGRVLELRAQIDQANIEKNILADKLNTLRSLAPNLATSSEISSIALPEKNPALVTLSQIKNLATQNVVALSNIRTSSSAGGTASLLSTSLSFEVTGPSQGIISFLNGVHNIAPITIVNKIKLNETGGTTQAEVTVSSFWAALPTQIPAVDQAVNTLTPDEQTVLNNLSSLTQPQFSNLSPSQAGKADPFAQ